MLWAVVASGQAIPEFYMSNQSTTECKGILFDSNAGIDGEVYAQNENYTFTICPGVGSQVQMSFVGPFCIETGFDFLRVYDGPNTASPLITTITGTTAPGTLVATSGCMTLQFTSDNNVACSGWEARWRTIVPPPVPPTINVPLPSCNATTLQLQLSSPIRCDSVIPANFVITGPVQPNVVSVTPVNCVNGLTNTFNLSLSEPISESCGYDVDFTLKLADACDSVYTFVLSDNFFVNTCPFTVAIDASQDTICPGGCVDLEAIASGCLSYTYTWNNGLPATAGPHQVCPLVTTSYTVNVQQQGGIGPVVSQTKTIVVLNPQIGYNGPDTICQSAPTFNFTANPPGGIWSGPGIFDEDNGTFDADTSGPGTFYISYSLGGLCSDSIRITVKPIDAGFNSASCPSNVPYQLTQFTPAGGVWSGPNVTPSGVFTPTPVGQYLLTYTINGCTDTRTVFVDNVSFTPPADSICQNVDTFSFVIQPPGGRWYGPGILDSLTGLFDPDDAGGGLHTFNYILNGCTYTFDYYVKPIQAFWNLASCPAQTFYQLPQGEPVGGTWSGIGVVDGALGTYNPNIFSPNTYTEDDLTYTHPNGCSDGITMYVVQTTIFRDTVERCVDENDIWLRWESVQVTPWNGSWVGPGTYFNNNNFRWYFSPSQAGPGAHTLIYTANTCVDSMVMVVYGPLTQPDTMVCELSAPFIIEQTPPGGTWVGDGIINASTGLFDPQAAQADTVWLRFETPRDCEDSVQIIIDRFIQADVGGVGNLYCAVDSLIPLTLSPANGTLTGPGVIGTDFNPLLAADSGAVTLYYTFGSGLCQSTDSVNITILPALQVDLVATNDSICFGGGTPLTAVPSGGNAQGFAFSWSNGLNAQPNNSVAPNQTTTYTVTVADGCSEPVTDSVTIFVFDTFSVSLTTSPIACYGTQGTATAQANGQSTYKYEWNLNPTVIGPTLNANVGGNYLLTVTDNISGCSVDTFVNIPGYSIVEALFSVNPNLECIPFEDSDITLIDLSTGGTMGNWFINGVDSGAYILGENPQFLLPNKGEYSIMLVLENEGGCRDTMLTDVCILDPLKLFVPNAFTPNADGVNENFIAKGSGVVKFEMRIYNRNNQEIHRTTDMATGWDGIYKGQVVPMGVYAYVIDVEFNDGVEFRKSGTVSVLR